MSKLNKLLTVERDISFELKSQISNFKQANKYHDISKTYAKRGVKNFDKVVGLSKIKKEIEFDLYVSTPHSKFMEIMGWR